MYTGIPSRQRKGIKVTLTLGWLFAGLGATAAAFNSPSVASELGTWQVIVFGSVLAISTIIAAASVVVNRYRWEWTSAWFAAGGISPYVLALWYAGLTQWDVGKVPQAALITALMLFFVHRALSCAGHAAKLRLLYEAEVELHAPVNGDD